MALLDEMRNMLIVHLVWSRGAKRQAQLCAKVIKSAWQHFLNSLINMSYLRV